MIGREAFKKIIELYKKFDEKTDDFNTKLENLLNTDFETDKPIYDGSVWLYWPLDGVRQMLKEILIDCGESEEGASWWMWENDFTFPTEIGLNGEELKINSIDDAYDYFVKLNELKEKEK